jgi:phenylacetate-coenzyme A ligase PaaK-like adenylate-forming protein
MAAAQVKQIQDMMGALLQAWRLRRHDRWTRADVKRHQQARLNEIVRHAARCSAFYREFYNGLNLDREIDLGALPVVDKATVMDNFNRLVTDPRLKLSDLEAHVGRSASDQEPPANPALTGYRLLSTTGTSGRRGLFVYDRAAWRTVLANTIRWQLFAGVRPRLPQRLRVCAIGADTALHISRCLPESGDVGLFRLLVLSTTQPLAELIAALNDFQPQVLMPYPSIAALLVEAQHAGRLSIDPEVVLPHSEALSEEMRRRLTATWNAPVFDHYGLTEEPHVACECLSHAGLHIFEDLCIVEVLDEAGKPAPPGRLGARYLLTNLYNRLQPLIRYEVTDMIAVTEAPCSCGRPFARITRIAGRSEQTLQLRGKHGESVAVPPIAFTCRLDVMPELVEYELHHDAFGIELQAVARPGVDREALRGRLTGELESVVRGLGAVSPAMKVEICDAIERRPQQMGKLHSVRASAATAS